MTPIIDELHEQLKAAAIAARRAGRAPWRNAHDDRLAREQEARETARECSKAQRPRPFEGVPEGCRRCSKCAEVLPLSKFKPRGKAGGARHSHCKPCVNAARRANEARKARRQTRQDTESAPEGTKRCTGCNEALPLDSFTIHKTQGRLARCTSCVNTYARGYARRKQGKTGSGSPRGTVSPERRREVVERIEHLTAVLNGAVPGERIASVEGWEMATSELQRLWLQSGDKQCLRCKAVVPPTAMLPPSPGNFYRGKCRSCSSAEFRENRMKVFGRVSDTAPTILLRDGTSITVAEMARRHRQRDPHRSKV